MLLPILVAVLILVFSNRRSPTVTTEKFYVAAAVIVALMLVAGTAALTLQASTPLPLQWLALFALVCLLDLPVALMQGVPAIEWARHALTMICLPGFAYGAYLLKPKAAKRLYWVAVALCGVITLYYLSLWLINPSFAAVHAQYDNAYWTAVGGVFASVIASGLLYPFAMRDGRRWFMVAFVVAIGGVAATFSRTFWVMTPVALVFATVLMVRRGSLKQSRFALLAGFAAIVLALTGGVLLAADTTRVDTTGLSGTQRLYESQAILSTMRSDPWTFLSGAGAGARYQEVAVDTTSLSDGLGTDTRDFSHDLYLQLLWNFGVTGMVVWLMALVLWLRFIGRSSSPYVVGCYAAVLAISLGSFTYQPFGDIGWDVLIGLLLGIGARLRGTQNASAPAASTRWSPAPPLARLDHLVYDSADVRG